MVNKHLLRGFVWLALCASASAMSPQQMEPPQQNDEQSHPPPPGLASPDTHDQLYRDARALLAQGKLAAAERAIRQDLAQHPDSGDAHFLLGHILFEEARQSAGAFDTAVANGPAGSKVKQERLKSSLVEFTEGARHRPPNAFDFKIVALDYVLLGDYADADKWLTRSLELSPKDAQAWYYMGRIKYNENHFQEAVHAFEEGLKLRPNDVVTEDNLGLSYQGLGEKEAATKAFLQAIAWQSNSENKQPYPYIDLGSFLIEQSRAAEAVPYLEQAARIAPKEVKAREQLGKAYLQSNQPDKAQVELEAAVALDPKSVATHFLLGRTYWKLGEKEKAKSEFDKCAALGGTHSNEGNLK